LSKRVKELLPMPSVPFKLLIVEGGDEEVVCKWLIGDPFWKSYWCWNASSRERLPGVAEAATNDANFTSAASVGVVFDVEGDIAGAIDIAEQTFKVLGSGNPGHAKFISGTKKFGLFMSPDGSSPGAVENLCRKAATRAEAAQCVNAYENCSGVVPLALTAHADKRWVNAYIAAVLGPRKFLPDALAEGLFDPAPFVDLKTFLLAL
jgi:hypothetical protein